MIFEIIVSNGFRMSGGLTMIKVSSTSGIFIQSILFNVSLINIISLGWIVKIRVFLIVLIKGIIFLLILLLLILILSKFLLLRRFHNLTTILHRPITQIISTIFPLHISLLRIIIPLRKTILIIILISWLLIWWFRNIGWNRWCKSLFSSHINNFPSSGANINHTLRTSTIV